MRRVGFFAAVAVSVAVAVAVWPREPEPFIVRPDPPMTDLERSEALHDEVKKFLTAFLREPREDRLAPDFAARLPDWDAPATIHDDGISIAELPIASIGSLRPPVDPERVDLGLYEFFASPAGDRAVAAAHWRVCGRRDGAAVEFECDIELEVVKTDEWRLRRFAPRRATRIEVRRPPMRDVTAAVGFEFAFPPEARDVIQSVIDNRAMTNVGGLNVVDWNGDDFPDIIATNQDRRTTLFLNDGAGGFLPAALPEEGALAYLVADLDDDGRDELVSLRPAAYRGDRAELGLYTRDGRRVHGALPFHNPPGFRELHFHQALVRDVDGDGRLDLFVVGYSNSESGRTSFNYVDARDGQRNLLFINRGGLRFSEEAEARGLDGTRYGYAAAFLDGGDLYVVNDFGPNEYFRARGNGTFERDDAHPLARGTTYGMGITIADFDNSGEPAIYVSNMYSHAGQRMVPLAGGLDEERRRMMTFAGRGNTLFRRAGGRWREEAVERGVEQAGWAWGAVFFDLDNDGDRDLFVGNGFTSHRDPAAPDY